MIGVSKMGSYTIKDRVCRLEKAVDNWVTCMFRYGAQMEKLGEQIAGLQCEIKTLKQLAREKSK
jgi:hypothetical protein